jgi:hypothetical protein
MSQNDVAQIVMDGEMVGIIGLGRVMQKLAEKFGDRFDDEVAEEMLIQLKDSNYMPETAREHYKEAFLREYKRFKGKEVGEDIKDRKITGALPIRGCCCG